MRLIIVTLLALSISFSATAVTAGHTDLKKEEKEAKAVLEKIGDKKVQLKFLTEPKGNILVRIKDADSGVIFKEIIKTEKEFKKNYDLSALAEGDYEFEVFTRQDGTINNFEITLGEEKSAGSNYFTKVKVIDAKKVALLVKAQGANKKYVRILDDGHVIFEDTFEGNKYGKLFTFERVASLDDLVFEVRDEKGVGEYLSAL
ncbi:hypothetical protein [Echinicola vietnamensis]|uniref:Uncharacterized protein n=1 Tax=Echinicola vietnamensis (strain DSM 17526 / LMG 23754 / KMM 6221) TaxID=926556 RepID=L0FY63_ECHVK|nr:hypothetical protein [Echinicola vietnamensis]AGA77983.1 hypothetical protein Echvi_1718 [Echinicola vietnamensis DSM 17526]